MSDLDDLRDRVEGLLKDASNDDWSAGELDDAVRLALADLSQALPARAVTTIDAVADQWEYDISGVSGLLAVVEVWYPYVSTDVTYKQPHPVKWRLLVDGSLLLEADADPDATYDLRIFYDKIQSLEGLDSATATTLSELELVALIQGAAGFASLAKGRYAIGRVNVGVRTPEWYAKWGAARKREFWARVIQLSEMEEGSEDSRIGWWETDKWDV